MTPNPKAVEAAARVMCDGSHGWTFPCPSCRNVATEVVAVVTPLLSAELVEARALLAMVPDAFAEARAEAMRHVHRWGPLGSMTCQDCGAVRSA